MLRFCTGSVTASHFRKDSKQSKHRSKFCIYQQFLRHTASFHRVAISLFLNYVTPLPGSDVFRIAVERGHLEAPRTFADWARFDYMQPNLVDITDEYRRCVSRFQEFLHLAYPLPGRRRLPEPVARGA